MQNVFVESHVFARATDLPFFAQRVSIARFATSDGLAFTAPRPANPPSRPSATACWFFSFAIGSLCSPTRRELSSACVESQTACYQRRVERLPFVNSLLELPASARR